MNAESVLQEFNHNASFEFEALEAAENYRNSILTLFSDYVGKEALEVGAGIGQFTDSLRKKFPQTAFSLIEPCEEFFRKLERFRPDSELFFGTVRDIPEDHDFDTIISINVLEHIEKDEEELSMYHERLVRKKGYFCVFTPARPELYAPLDVSFGHFRRYTRSGLVQKLEHAGFEVEFCRYFNFPGYFLWLLEFKILKKQSFHVRKVRFFDRFLFPIIHHVEKWIHPPLGQSVVAVARAKEK